jgi:hypothetical protein
VAGHEVVRLAIANSVGNDATTNCRRRLEPQLMPHPSQLTPSREHSLRGGDFTVTRGWPWAVRAADGPASVRVGIRRPRGLRGRRRASRICDLGKPGQLPELVRQRCEPNVPVSRSTCEESSHHSPHVCASRATVSLWTSHSTRPSSIRASTRCQFCSHETKCQRSARYIDGHHPF